MNYQTTANIAALAHLVASANCADENKMANTVKSLMLTPETEQVLFDKISELTKIKGCESVF